MGHGRPYPTVSTNGQYPVPAGSRRRKPDRTASVETPARTAGIRGVVPPVEAVPAGVEQEVEAQAAEVEVLPLPLRPQ